MSDKFYPKLDEGQLRTIKKLMSIHPDYLDDPACPYSDETKQILGSNQPVTKQIETELAEIDFESMDGESLLTEINRVYNELKASGVNITGAESAEKNTYFRLSVSLLREVVVIREKVTNMINTSKFTEIVLQAMEEILDTEQRNLFLERIKRARE